MAGNFPSPSPQEKYLSRKLFKKIKIIFKIIIKLMKNLKIKRQSLIKILEVYYLKNDIYIHKKCSKIPYPS